MWEELRSRDCRFRASGWWFRMFLGRKYKNRCNVEPRVGAADIVSRKRPSSQISLLVAPERASYWQSF